VKRATSDVGDVQRKLARARLKFVRGMRKHNRNKPASKRWRDDVARGKMREDSYLPG
jgi:hypothetical protein